MKKTIKLLLIFMGGITALIVVALGGFLIIDKNKTYYIYDVRIVEPVEGMSGYIYTDSEAEYVSIKNQSFYMSSEEKNFYPIAIYASSSNNSTNIKITSSDSSIAQIVYKDGGCFVQFLKEGFVTITSELDGVKDNLIFHIYDQVPSDFTVYDYNYYGDYAELFPNTLVSYADNMEYRYKFFMDNASETGDNEHIDGDLIRLDTANLDNEVFSNVYIDFATKELVVQCKKPESVQKENIDSVVILQSFFRDKDGQVKLENDYIVKIHIVLYIPEFLQIEVSTTPNFDERTVFVNTESIDISSITKEQILENPSLLDEYLSAEKAENYLINNNENSTYKAFFTDRVERLYLRFRMVYTNGDIVYLKDGENANFVFSNPDLCVEGPTNDYYVLILNDENYFINPGISRFEITLDVFDFEFPIDDEKFNFIYKTSSSENVEDFYIRDAETGFYTFTYWDQRARFVNEIYDADGNIVGFGW